MFDNWLKNFDVLDYKTVKNNFVEYKLILYPALSK
jgi:hypothetical protein